MGCAEERVALEKLEQRGSGTREGPPRAAGDEEMCRRLTASLQTHFALTGARAMPAAQHLASSYLWAQI